MPLGFGWSPFALRLSLLLAAILLILLPALLLTAIAPAFFSSAGGLIGMLALNGIFILVTQHGLEVRLPMFKAKCASPQII